MNCVNENKQGLALEKIRRLADQMGQESTHNISNASEILFWCDELEGKNKKT